MLGAVAIMMAAAGLLAAWKGLPVLLVGRLLTGVAAGLAAGTAITYLVELRLRADPGRRWSGPGPSAHRSMSARSVSVRSSPAALRNGRVGRSPCPTWSSSASGRSLLSACASCRKQGRRRHAPPTHRPKTLAPSARPAAAGTMAAFAANGLFAGLAGLILATTLGRTSHALSGATLFLVFTCGAVSQPATARLAASARARPRHGFHARRPRVPRGLGSPFEPEPLALPGLGCADRRRCGCRLQGDHRHRARSSGTRGPTGPDIEAACRPLCGLSIPVVGAGIALNKGQASPTPCWLRHPGRPGRLGIGLALLGTSDVKRHV